VLAPRPGAGEGETLDTVQEDAAMRRPALGAALACLALVTACGGGSGTGTTAAPEPAAPAPSAASGGASEPAAPDAASSVLTGVVGTPEDPDAFVITLTDASGEPVTSLPAGDYQIEVSDLSEIHNFHLVGEGVEETTTVPEVTDVTWDVTLEPGDYTFVCDPHPSMVGEFTVT
jgi:hypothetical protein